MTPRLDRERDDGGVVKSGELLASLIRQANTADKLQRRRPILLNAGFVSFIRSLGDVC
jgi:hypothetical protein